MTDQSLHLRRLVVSAFSCCSQGAISLSSCRQCFIFLWHCGQSFIDSALCRLAVGPLWTQSFVAVGVNWLCFNGMKLIDRSIHRHLAAVNLLPSCCSCCCEGSTRLNGSIDTKYKWSLLWVVDSVLCRLAVGPLSNRCAVHRPLALLNGGQSFWKWQDHIPKERARIG